MNNEYAMGLAFGIFTGLIIFIVIWKFSRRKLKGSFDERQELVRGRGYKYACFTLLVLLGLDLLAESFELFDTLPVTRSFALFFIVLVGVMVYALYCVRNDSYFGIGTDTRTYRALMWVIVALNGFSAITGFRNGAFIDGKLAFGPASALLICIAFAILMITLYVRKKSSADEDAEDDEE